MVKNFLWGIILFFLNVFVLYLNYSKDFSLPLAFFIEFNQIIAFVVGVMYSQQCRKFDLKHILGVISNSLIYSILMSILFGIYGASVKFTFTLLLFIAIFLCMFISYSLYYWLFCPDKYKKRYAKFKGKHESNSKIKRKFT